MKTAIERLAQAYKTTMRGGVCNDHDYIARVRPVDLGRVVKQVAELIDQLDKAKADRDARPDITLEEYKKLKLDASYANYD